MSREELAQSRNSRLNRLVVWSGLLFAHASPTWRDTSPGREGDIHRTAATGLRAWRAETLSGGRALARPIVAGAAFAITGVLLLMAGARWGISTALSGPLADGGWTARSRAWFVARGVFDGEFDPVAQRHFSWTGKIARFTLPHLARSSSHWISFEVVGARPPSLASPELSVSVDGSPGSTWPTSNNPQRITIQIPPRDRDGAVVAFDLSNTFVPGAADPRNLGVLIYGLALSPASGGFRLAKYVLARAGLAVFFAVFGLLLCGFTRGIWIAAAGVVIAFVWLLLQDGAFIGMYVDRLLNLGVGAALAGALVALAQVRRSAASKQPAWAVAAAIILGVTVVKFAFFVHPLVTIGDAVFQVHRAQLVRGGTYFFTSVTPRPFFEFPYAIALYVAALPFWSHFPTLLDQVQLLRGIALIADAFAGLALYAAARRQWPNRRAPLLVAVLWPFARAPLQALCNANLTNLFGQSVFAAGMGVAAWAAAPRSGNEAEGVPRDSVGGISGVAVALTGACALLTVAFLSHFSTLTIGLTIACAAGAAAAIGGRGEVRRAGVGLLVATIVAAAAAYAIYYSNPRFTPVYRVTWARVAAGEGADNPGKLVAPVSTKLHHLLDEAGDDYGLPGLVLGIAAIAGAILLARRRPREGLTLMLGASGLIWLAFTLLGLFSPIQMRANLAAAPLFVCLGAYAIDALAARSRWAAILAGATLTAIGWSGVSLWLMCLGR